MQSIIQIFIIFFQKTCKKLKDCVLLNCTQSNKEVLIIKEKRFMLNEQLCFSAYSLSKQFMSFYRPILEPYSLTYTQYIVLLHLWENASQNVKLLGESVRLDSGTLTPVLKRMEKNGYIVRTRNPEDERQVMVDLTDHALNIKEKLLSEIASCYSNLELNEQEYFDLLAQMDKLTEKLGGINDEKIIRNDNDK